MKTHRWRVLLPLLLVLPGPAAEKIKVKPGPENLEWLKHNDTATLLEWRYPDYPAEPAAEWSQAAVLVKFVVDSAGQVTGARAFSGPEKFQAAALTAVARWKFRPAMTDGRPSPVAKEVRLVFTPAGTPRRAARDEFMPSFQVVDSETSPPGDPANSDPIYPPGLKDRRLTGEVGLVLDFNPTGRVDGVEVVRATHPEFLGAALDTVAGWEVSPARQGTLPVAGLKRVVLNFFTVDDDLKRNDAGWLGRNGIVFQDQPGTKPVDYFEQTLEAVQMV